MLLITFMMMSMCVDVFVVLVVMMCEIVLYSSHQNKYE